MTRFPSVFISHGSPMMIVEDSPAKQFLARLGRDLGRPMAPGVILHKGSDGIAARADKGTYYTPPPLQAS